MAESSNNITALIRGISQFDGNAAKLQDWKRSTRAILRLARPKIHKIIAADEEAPGDQDLGG